MTTLTLECPDEMFSALGKRPVDATREITLMAALKLYESGRVSSGLAAQFCGLSRVDFLLSCGEHNISVFQQTFEELSSDLREALDASGR